MDLFNAITSLHIKMSSQMSSQTGLGGRPPEILEDNGSPDLNALSVT